MFEMIHKRIQEAFGDRLKLEVRSKRTFLRGGFEVFEIIFAEVEPGIDLLAWVRQPIDEKYIEGMENPVIRCKFFAKSGIREDQARKKVAAIFDNYWKVVGELAPREERHGL